MNTQLLISELNSLESISLPIRQLYEKESSIPEIKTEKDIDYLTSLFGEIDEAIVGISVNSVNLKNIVTHANLVLPFESAADLEDYFV